MSKPSPHLDRIIKERERIDKSNEINNVSKEENTKLTFSINKTKPIVRKVVDEKDKQNFEVIDSDEIKK